MRIKIFSFAVILLLQTLFSFGQVNDSTKQAHHPTYNDYKDLRKKQKESGIDTLVYLNALYNFQVKIPNWLNLREAGSELSLGGTLPPVDGIENAILITGFPKSKYKSFAEFTEIYSTGDTMFKPTRYSKEIIWYGANPSQSVAHGIKQKVYTMREGNLYHNQFVLLETKSGYIWIQFCATPGTYEKNISKFDEFMAGFKLTGF